MIMIVVWLAMGLYASIRLHELDGEHWTRCTVCTAPYIGAVCILGFFFVSDQIAIALCAVPAIKLMRMYNGDR